jgi:hypothetical protein
MAKESMRWAKLTSAKKAKLRRTNIPSDYEIHNGTANSRFDFIVFNV